MSAPVLTTTATVIEVGDIAGRPTVVLQVGEPSLGNFNTQLQVSATEAQAWAAHLYETVELTMRIKEAP